jgi:hypothetical protein
VCMKRNRRRNLEKEVFGSKEGYKIYIWTIYERNERK